MEKVELTMPGAVYYECFDPMCTDVSREEGWPAPTSQRRGRGWRMSYCVTREQALSMLEHATDWGAAMSYGVDDPRPGRMVARWAEREASRLVNDVRQL